MPTFAFANNVKTTLAGAIGSTATTITLASSENFPTIPGGYVWAVTLNDQATQTLFEIVYVTAISGTNLTVLRGQEGTAARGWNVGDFVFAADTAGVLNSFINQSQYNGLVQLSPGSVQSGYINVSGPITSASTGNFNGVNVGGALNGATTGNFSSQIFGLNFISSLPYSNTSIINLPFRFNGATTIGLGASSGLNVTGANGDSITASALAVGAASTGRCVVIDTNANIATYGNVYAGNGVFVGQVLAPAIYQSGAQVVSTLSSSTLSLTKTGSNYAINYTPSSQVGIGSSVINDGNGGNPTLSLPNYGQWFIEVLYGVQMVTNTNMTIVLNLVGGTMTGGFITNANNHTAFNAVMWVAIYGKGHTTVNNQTLTFALPVSGGAFDPSNQPWTVRATRTA